MLNLYRRHLKTCDHRTEGRSYRRCKCPIWVDGLLGKEDIRESLKLRDWQRASDGIHQWESWGSREDPNAKPKPGLMTISAALTAFAKDADARGLERDSARRYRQLERLKLEFAASKGLRYLKEFDVALCREFRATWVIKGSSARKRLQHLRSFFRFCQESEWITKNPAKSVTPPMVETPPMMPFSRAEVDAILVAAPNLEAKAMILLLRYSGLRISDAATLSSERIRDGKLFLRTMKTKVVVFIPLPDVVIAALDAVRRRNGYYFWSGASRKSSICDTWRKRLSPVFKAAAIADGYSHRFRDTFAVELLLAGVPLERLSVLLGHNSVKTTEEHYAPWVLDRQRQIEEDVRRTWTKGTQEVHSEKILVN